MSDRVRVWCLRHGESENVTAGIAGAVPAAPLTGRGRQQASQAAQALAGEPITAVYSSTALRAQQTARLLAASFGVEVSALPELAEVGIGQHEGTTDPAIRRRTAQVLRAWVVEQDLQQRVADGETGQHVLDRMTAAFQQIASTHPGETVAVVGHVASLTLALSRLCAIDPRIWGKALPHARPFLVASDSQTWNCPACPACPACSACPRVPQPPQHLQRGLAGRVAAAPDPAPPPVQPGGRLQPHIPAAMTRTRQPRAPVPVLPPGYRIGAPAPPEHRPLTSHHDHPFPRRTSPAGLP